MRRLGASSPWSTPLDVDGTCIIIGVRPSSLEDAVFAPRGWPQIKAEAGVTEKLGSEVDVIFPIKSPPVQHEVMVAQFDNAAKDSPPAGGDPGQPSAFVGAGESLWTARVNPKTSARPGSAVNLAVDTSALYWFDPDSGRAIARQAAGDRSGNPPGRHVSGGRRRWWCCS